MPVEGGDSGSGDSGSGDSGGSTTTGSGGVVKSTIVVKAGETFDGGGKRFIADASTLGDGSQDEGQLPVFKLESGAKLKNVVLGSPAADGIHTYGNVTLENVVWEDIGEDALTVKGAGTVVINGGSAKDGDDKVFQINAASTFKVSNFKAESAGKFIRQNGGTTFKVDVIIDRCDISKMKESIFRTDSSTSTVTMTNTRYSQIGNSPFIGVKSSNISTSNNTEY
ncbi:pectate lyase [Sorangium sp. So ce1389]|uniref:pectate lyase n=1 Tax=Sorangium sp. So ce1389 TaxID=3133336 RepID=UPI003F5E71D3